MLAGDWESSDSECIDDLAALICAGRIPPKSGKLLLAIGTTLNKPFKMTVELSGLLSDIEQ